MLIKQPLLKLTLTTLTHQNGAYPSSGSRRTLLLV